MTSIAKVPLTGLALACSLALAACGQPAPNEPASAPTAATSKNPNTEMLGERYIDLLPQWVPIANTADGGSLAYDLKALKKPVEGLVDLQLQITHGAPQETTIEEKDVVRKISYQQELVRLRYRCPTREFAIVAREIRDEANKPILREDTPTAPFGPISGNGMATVAYNPACAER
jgi:hypothetical protein